MPVGAIAIQEYPPANEVPYTPPPPPQYRFDSMDRRVPAYFCPCGGIATQLPDYSLPHPPVQMLAIAFRGASSVEVWRLSRDIPLDVIVPLRRYGLTYRDAAILGFLRTSDVHEMTRLFTATANAIAQDADEWFGGIETDSPRPKRANDAVDRLRFHPDLAITFAGAFPARVEFGLESGVAFIRVPGEWGFVSLTPRAVEDLRRLAEAIPTISSSPLVVPSDVFAGSAD